MAKSVRPGVRLGGVTIRRVTGFNAKFINDNKVGPGAVLKITRSGDVIPHILEVVAPSRKAGLPEDGNFEWTSSGVDIRATGDTDEQLVKQIAWFFKAIEVENFAQGTIQRLATHGIDSIEAVIRATKKDLMAVPGIQDKTATTIVTGIKKALNPVSLPVLMAASGVFGPGFGVRQLTPLVEKYPQIMDLNRPNPRDLEHMALSVSGFSSKRAKQFAQGFPKFRAFVKPIKRLITIETLGPVAPPEGDKMSGEIVVFTGFRDKDLQEQIEREGGTIASGISRKVTVLVMKLKGTGSSKERKAVNLGIKIMTREELVETFNLEK